MNNSSSRLTLLEFVNHKDFIWLNQDQALAVVRRNLKAAKELGLTLGIYMSLIDPDWPVE